MIAAALLISLSLAAQAADADPSTIVSGHVVDATTGRPIPGAVIWTAGSSVAPPGASGRVRVISSGSGAFVLRGIGKGSLVLTAAKGGYVNAAPGQRRPGGSGQPIPVDGGHRISNVEIRMWKYAAIGGTVVDEYGDPAVNVRVEALRRTFVAGRSRFEEAVSSALTDDRGVYRIAGLTPSEYVVRIPSTQTSVPWDLIDAFFGGTPLPDSKRMQISREMNAAGSAIAPAGSPYAMRAGSQTFSLPPGSLTPAVTPRGTIVYPTVYFPLAPNAAQAAIVRLRSGEERVDADMQIRPALGVAVSGVLVGPEGPVPILTLRLMPAEDDATTAPLPAATTMTDWNGAFTFAAVPPGQYMLSALRVPQPPPDVEGTARVSVMPGGTMTIASSPPAAPSGPPPVLADATLVAQVPLSIGDSNLDDLVVALSAAPRLSGRIEFHGTRDKPSPEAVAGMRILLDRADGIRPFAPSIAAGAGHADERGVFRTYGVPPGRYVVGVTPMPSKSGWYLESAIYDGRDIADLPIDLVNKDLDGVVITFTDRPSAIAGSVSGARGTDATAIVIAFPTDEAMWTSAPRRLRTARAAEDGSFAIEALPPGEYYVAAVQEDFVGEWQDTTLLRALTGAAQTVHVLEGERTSVSLRAAAVR